METGEIYAWTIGQKGYQFVSEYLLNNRYPPGMIKKYWYLFLQHQDTYLGSLSCRAMKWRKFSPYPIHPKHLFDEKRVEYLHQYFRPGMRFLDLGSGVGSECILAAKMNARLSVGIEYNSENLSTAVRRAADEGVDAVFFRGDLEEAELPFADNIFDLINFSNVLEHIHNRIPLLQDLKRVKKKDGYAIISVPNAETSWKRKLESVGLDPRDDTDHKVEYTREELVSEFLQADLTCCSDFAPIIPSFPWNGAIAMSAALSPELYKRLQRKKRQYVEKMPEESIGWIVTVQ